MTNLKRRKFVLAAGAVIGVGGLTAWIKKNEILQFGLLQTSNLDLALSEAPAKDNQCVLTSRQVEGPYFITSPERSSIKEDRSGKALLLRVQVVRSPSCQPIPNAKVEIWHCDANGNYSGHPEGLADDMFGTMMHAGTGDKRIEPENDKRYLRGMQQTNSEGWVEFQTIFPGWYKPRTPHIHVKVLVDDSEVLTTQFYFEEAFFSKVYAQLEPYNRRGPSLFTPENDVVLNNQPQANGLLLKPTWSETLPLSVDAQIGIEKSV